MTFHVNEGMKNYGGGVRRRGRGGKAVRRGEGRGGKGEGEGRRLVCRLLPIVSELCNDIFSRNVKLFYIYFRIY